MKIANYFKRIGTVKHKFKIQFAIDTLQMTGTVSEDINVIIKRGSQKESTSLGKLRKGKLDFKKERLIFSEVTMFYDTTDNEYLPKEAEIRVIINGENGKRKLAGIIQLDLADYANQKLQFKRQEKELTKCPEKIQSKLSYEVFMKFLRQSNSQTAGSMIGGLEAQKLKKKQQKRRKQEQNNRKNKKDQKSNEQSFSDNEHKQKQNNVKIDSKNKPVTVHFDKQLQLENDEQQQNEIAQKHSQQEQQLEHNNQIVFEQYQRPKTIQKLSQQILPQQQLPQIQIKHEDTQVDEQFFKKLQKQIQKLFKQNQQLQLKTTSLKQRLSQVQLQKSNMLDQMTRNTTYDNIGKYEVRIKQLKYKIQTGRKTKKQNQNHYQQLNDKYIQLKNQIDGERVNASYHLNKIQEQFKGQHQTIKEQIKKIKTVVDKQQKQYKTLSKQVSQLKRQEELKQLIKKQAEGKIIEIELEVNKLRMRVCDAMNIAALANNDELSEFLIQQFRS